MKKILLAIPFIIWLLSGSQIMSEPNFPALTGRVIDQAGILSRPAVASLDRALAAHEGRSDIQIVAVVLKNLDGMDIGDYGFQLGRHWGIGQKGKNNGVLLIVAMEERKIRIEVGYGLEGLLTDALSKDIIENIIKPQFRARNFEQGIVGGIGKIIEIVDKTDSGLPVEQVTKKKKAEHGKSGIDWISVIFGVIFIIYFIIRSMSGGGHHPRSRGGLFGGIGGLGGGGFGGFGGGGGFSGGGGSFGGGGASGNW